VGRREEGRKRRRGRRGRRGEETACLVKG